MYLTKTLFIVSGALYVMFQPNFLLSHAMYCSHLLLFSSHAKPGYYANSFLPYRRTSVRALPTRHSSSFSPLSPLLSIQSLSFVKHLLIFLLFPLMTNLPLLPYVEIVTLSFVLSVYI